MQVGEPFPAIVNGQPLLARCDVFSGGHPAALEWDGPQIALGASIDIASGKFAVRGRIVETPSSAEGHHRAEIVGPLMTDRLACLVAEKRSDGSWGTFLATFVKRGKFELFWMNPSMSEEPSEGDWGKRLVVPPDGRVRESGVMSSRSEEEAVRVAFAALDDVGSAVHDRGILPLGTRVYVSSGGPLREPASRWTGAASHDELR